MPRNLGIATTVATALPRPRSEFWEWQLRASCRGRPSDTFFGEDESPTGEHEVAAKKICSSCPVISACREHAVRTREPHGVWGGLSPSERTRLRWSYR
ncbi:WhiB family transcriptional regulator [Rhodococcus cercidiphylli]|uniref:Transcriptional regulator WhiB n=1 Tax=Rhodococcus cercidiphylli TaxID=489916 RepID=A0ABU4AWC4_9NOCA|nr:WhiB family transcriptional regulator [Rhodococcus cercidiphylli]MDV6230543.1 WhiB family transcriptional regulator [Rhodococcus cercidiphylli]